MVNNALKANSGSLGLWNETEFPGLKHLRKKTCLLLRGTTIASTAACQYWRGPNAKQALLTGRARVLRGVRSCEHVHMHAEAHTCSYNANRCSLTPTPTHTNTHTQTNTLNGPELATLPGRLEFPCWCSAGELRRGDSRRRDVWWREGGRE